MNSFQICNILHYISIVVVDNNVIDSCRLLMHNMIHLLLGD